MACSASKTPFLRAIATRGFSAQAKLKSPGKTNELQITTLPNKLVVASIDGDSAFSNVAVVFPAGSRNETYETEGISHILRVCGSLSNKKSSSFGVKTGVASTGGCLNVVSDRESIAYKLALKRDELSTGLKYLHDVSVQQEIRPYELRNIAYRIKDDLAKIPSVAKAIDLLHKAAYYQGLGNSVFCPKRNINNITPDEIESFIAKNYVTAGAAVIGVGVDHGMLCAFADSFELEPKSASKSPSKYIGGQLRADQSGGSAVVAIATQGASLANQKEALSFAVLRKIAGGGKTSQYSDATDGLDKVVGGSLSKPYCLNALNVSYSDSGLFGFVLEANAEEIGKGIDVALKALKSGSVSQNDVGRAKAQLKVEILESIATPEGRLDDLVAQAISGKEIQGKSEIVAAIDAISVADVNAAAKKVASGKWSVGAVGNLKNVPHVNELN